MDTSGLTECLDQVLAGGSKVRKTALWFIGATNIIEVLSCGMGGL